jgi:predicted DCC family thiol-disulfide oxidoreductase YuxK
VYDDACAVCQVATAAVVLADRHGTVTPCGLGAPEAAELLAAVPAAARARSVHLVNPDGRVVSAGAACADVARLLPGFGGLGRLGRAAPDMTERVYARAVGHRDRVARVVPERVSRGARRIIGRRLGQA